MSSRSMQLVRPASTCSRPPLTASTHNSCWCATVGSARKRRAPSASGTVEMRPANSWLRSTVASNQPESATARATLLGLGLVSGLRSGLGLG
eukprot:scaffold64073_cov57-Phaeocystis_antarctica.AAC.4